MDDTAEVAHLRWAREVFKESLHLYDISISLRDLKNSQAWGKKSFPKSHFVGRHLKKGKLVYSRRSCEVSSACYFSVCF